MIRLGRREMCLLAKYLSSSLSSSCSGWVVEGALKDA